MKCDKCGTENDKYRQFCISCGSPIASNMIDPIDFGNTQAMPVVVTPIEPMPKEEELKNTSVIPVVSDGFDPSITINNQEEKKEIKKETPKKNKKSGSIFIIIFIVLFLAIASAVVYYLYKKDMIPFKKQQTETTTQVQTTTTTVKVQMDTELKATTTEINYNNTNHYLKYSYEITNVDNTYKPVLKIYLDEKLVGNPIIQDNSYELNDVYDAILHTNIFTYENQNISGVDKEYYYINVFVNNKYYVLILNNTVCIYTNITDMFTTKDPDYIYNNKSSLIKNGAYAYIKKYDETNGIEQLSSISNDQVTFTDGEVIGGFFK